METCDDGNMDDNDACPACMPASCGDGFVWQGMETCDDGNNVSNDGCDAMCEAECNGTIVQQNLGGFTYYKVPVMGTMNDDNIAAACLDCGLQIPCAGPNGCNWNDNQCVQTNNESDCGLPMNGLSASLCGANVYPSECQALHGVYQYMGHNWNGNAGCGAEPGNWCASGNSYMNRFALCVSN